MIGGLAAFLTLNYVSGVESDTAQENQLVEVLVASAPIPKGASADEAIATGAVSAGMRRRADLPANVVTRDAEISGQVAAVDLGGGEIITSTMFVADNALSGSKGTSLDKGNVAVTINVDGAAGVAGLIQPGDSINIMARTSAAGEGLSNPSQELSAEGWQLSSPYVYSFQDVKVLAVGTNLGEPVVATPGVEGEAAPAAAPSGLITVQLPADKAILLASVKDSELYLTLNRPDYEPTPQPFFNQLPFFPGELGESPYPEQPAASDGQ